MYVSFFQDPPTSTYESHEQLQHMNTDFKMSDKCLLSNMSSDHSL